MKITRKFLLILSSSVLLLYALIIVAVGYKKRTEMIEHMETQLTASAEALATQAEGKLNSTVSSYLKALTKQYIYITETVDKMPLTQEDKKNVLFKLFKEQPVGKTGYIYITRGNGTIIFHPNRSLLGTKSVISDELNRLKKNEYARHHYWYNNRHKYLYRGYYEAWDWNIMISAYSDEFIHFLDLEEFSEEVLKYKTHKTGYQYIFDLKGNYIVHANAAAKNVLTAPEEQNRIIARQMIKMKSGVLNYHYKGRYGPGGERVVSFIYNPDLKWIIAASGNVKDYVNLTNLAGEIMLLSGGFMLLLIVFIILICIILMKEYKIKEKNLEIIATQKELVLKLGEMIETRSKETSSHVKRVALISDIISREYGLKEADRDLIKFAAPLHDVGKIGITDTIIHKEGKLTPDEYEIIKTHTDIGYNLLKESSRELLKAAAIIAWEHHENWDGSGYPLGKKGRNIHIFARIVSIADVLDALLSKRSYKEEWHQDEVVHFLRENSGIKFDPDLIEIVMDNRKEIFEIRESVLAEC